MTTKGDYGEHEYEVTASARVYADSDEEAHEAGMIMLARSALPQQVEVRLIDDEGEGEMKDETMPTGNWKFDQDVTDAFDDMLERSIPQYEVMRRAVHDIAAEFLDRNGGAVLDLGCSRGEAIAQLADEFEATQFLGIDESRPMVEAFNKRFAGYDNVGGVCADISEPWPDLRPQVVLSVLTLQFVKPSKRLDVVRRVHDALERGGVFLLVEKVQGRSIHNDNLFTDLYHASKRRNGYSDEAIRAKATALREVLIPLAAVDNEQMLAAAGFLGVECFWRWMNFAGWLAVK